MRRAAGVVAAISILVFLAGCGEDEEVAITSLSDILSGRVPDGELVTVEGTVTDTGQLPAISRDTYDLSTPDGRRVLVVAQGGAPGRLQTLRVQAVVRTAFKVGSVNLGTVLRERSRQELPIEEEGGLPWWVFVSLGSLAALVVGVILAFVVRARRRRRTRARCPHCGASTDPDWVVCTVCGNPLDVSKAPAPTIIAPPPLEPPQPEPDETAERERPSAATLLIPPDEGDWD
jgi:hypothetical protein